MDTQGSLPGLLDLARGRGGNGIGDGHPPPPISPLPADRIAIYQALADLPQEADLVTLSSSLLGINSQEREFLPVALPQQGIIPDLGKELPLDTFQSVDGCLISRRPELAAIIQPSDNLLLGSALPL